jgi:hypothetical protein
MEGLHISHRYQYCSEISLGNAFNSGGPWGGGEVGVFKAPRNSEVLTKLIRIPSSVENTSVTTLDIPKGWKNRTGLQIERNPWLAGYRPQIPVLSALCPQLNLLNTPPPEKFPGYATAEIHSHPFTGTLIQGKISTFAWRDWRKLRESMVSLVGKLRTERFIILEGNC